MKRTKFSAHFLLVLLVALPGYLLHAQNINRPNKVGPLGTQVNTLTGNVFIKRTDFNVPGRFFDFDATFYYNSYTFFIDEGFGNGWNFMYNISCRPDTAGARRITWGDARTDIYDSIPGGTYKTPRGFFSKLVQYEPGKFRLTEPDSVVFFFDNPAHRKLTRVQEPNGNFINFIYTDSLLTSMVNAAGQTITLAYNAAGRLTGITDAAATPARTFSYTYDLAGNLKEAKDPMGGTFKYTYLVNGPMKTLTDRNNNTVNLIYFTNFSASELIGCNKRISFSYDTLNKRTVVTDHMPGNNQVTTYTYQKLDNLAWVTSVKGNCCGFGVSFEYDGQGNKIKEQDANGNTYEYTYDGKGNMLTIKDPLGQVSTFTYSSLDKITSYRDPKGYVYTLSYDAAGNLLQVVMPGNTVYAATYNSKGDIISSTDPKGNVYTYNYDAFGNPVSVTAPHGYHATLSYDARGNLLSYTDSRGHSNTGEYDILGRLKKITDPINNTRQFAYDAEGNMTSIINENNEASTLYYDASNRLVKAVGPTGSQAAISYDGMNNITSIKNALGHETKYSYDALNRLKSSGDPLNNIATFSYDPNGNITALNLPNGQSFSYEYDKLNRVTAVKDVISNIADFTYDANGNITSYTNATGAITTYRYDSLNRIKEVSDALGNTVVFTRDKKDNITAITDRNGFTRHYTYDNLDRVTTIKDNNGSAITITYDTEGNILQLKDQNNNTTSYTYDNRNRRKRMTYPDGTYVEFTYDKEGNVTAKRLADGTTIGYQYDALNRVVAKTLPNGHVYTYTYDAMGRMITATNNAGTVTLTYDALNRLTSESFDGRVTKYEYNMAGRTQTTVYPDNSKVIKEFDARSRLVKILKDSVTIAEYVYNDNNQLSGKSYANGVNTLMQYDFANRLSSITTGNGSVQNMVFTYDKEMNKATIGRLNNPSLSEQFTYDNAYRLTNYKRGVIGGMPAVQNTYNYDALGNRTSASLNGINTVYTVNSLNQLTGVTGAQNITFTYDGRGNLTYDGRFYKTYDAEGRLLKDSSSPASIITYAYDALNRRVIKSINGNTFKYTYSGRAQIEERNSSNAVLNQTVYRHFLSPVMNSKDGNNYYYHQNELYSVEAITNSSGNLVERYEYDVYGKLSRFDAQNNPLSASPSGNRVGFTGQEYDSATGSYRFFYRNYSPEMGTFNQRDLIEYNDGMGMYQYVGNNPANGVDVLGLAGGGGGGGGKKKKKPKAQVRCRSEGALEAQTTMQYFKDLKKFIETIQAHKTLKDIKGLQNTAGPIGTTLKIATAPFDLGLVAIEADAMIQGYDQRSGVENFEMGSELAMDGVGAGAAMVTAYAGIAGTAVVGAPVAAGAATVTIVIVGLQTIDAQSQAAFDSYYSFQATQILNEARDNFRDPQAWQNQFNSQETGEFFYNRRVELIKKKYCEEGGCDDPFNMISMTLDLAMNIVVPFDPNEIIGPKGEGTKKWVSVNDRMPYTILFENDSTATAPARFIRITTPIEPKQDASTFQLGNFGFNNLSFDVPEGTASYYTRLDARDSTGLFIDVTAGYDQMNNVVFWEFQGIDPVTQLPPDDPNVGFLFLQDTSRPEYGNGFVSFTIKPKSSSVTLDTIGARASIIFDSNEPIATNIYTNTIDAFPPSSQLTSASADNAGNVTLKWTGADDQGGCGIRFYTIYVSTDGTSFSVFAPVVTGTDTTFRKPGIGQYCFFVLATDSVGNAETLNAGEVICTTIEGSLPVSWLYFRGKNIEKDNRLEWSTASEQNNREFIVERSLTGSGFTAIGRVAAAGNASVPTSYHYIDRNIDRLNSDVMYYRLKQVDMNGRFKYSSIVRINYNVNGTIKSIVYPNPTNGMITVTIGDAKLMGTQALVFDENGRQLQSVKITSTSQPIDLGRYMNGIYFIKLANAEVLRVLKY